MTEITTRLGMLALGLSLIGCAPGASGNQLQTGPEAPGERTASIEVTNNNWQDMRVYVENGGTRMRLGTVTSMGSQIFRIPRAIVNGAGSQLRLVADPIGVRNVFTSQPIQVSPGQRVEFRIENHMPISSISVWHQ